MPTGKRNGLRSVADRLWDRFYRPSKRELRLYERVGVPVVGRYMPAGGSRFRVTDSFIHTGKPRAQALREFVAKTIRIEIGHTLCGIALLILLFPEIADDLDHQRYDEVLIYLAAIILPNLYPSMLQRYNRARVLPLLARTVKSNQNPAPR